MKTVRLAVTALFVALLLSIPAQATAPVVASFADGAIATDIVIDGTMAAEPTAPTTAPVSESYNPDGLSNLPEPSNPYEPARIYSPHLNRIVQRMFIIGVVLVVISVVGFVIIAVTDRRGRPHPDKPDPNGR